MMALIQKNILKTLGIDRLPPIEQEEIVERMGNIIFSRIMRRVAGMISDEDKVELEKLMSTDKGKSDEVLEFLQSKIPELDRVVEEEVRGFADRSVAVMKTL